MFKEIIIKDEKYYFTSNDSFKIEGEELSKPIDNGIYKFDNIKNELEFSGNIIDEMGIPVSEFTHKWKWSIVSFEDGILTVDIKNYNFQTKVYSTVGTRVSYLKK